MGRQNRKGRWGIYAVFFVTGRYSNRMEFKGGSHDLKSKDGLGRYSNRMEFKGYPGRGSSA